MNLVCQDHTRCLAFVIRKLILILHPITGNERPCLSFWQSAVVKEDIARTVIG